MELQLLLKDLSDVVVAIHNPREDVDIDRGLMVLIPGIYPPGGRTYFCSYRDYAVLLKQNDLPANSIFFVSDCREASWANSLKEQDREFSVFLSCPLEKLVHIISQSVKQHLQDQPMQHYRRMQDAWTKIMQSERTDETDSAVLPFIRSLSNELKEYVSVIVIRQDPSFPQLHRPNRAQMLNELERLFPGQNLFPYEDQIIMLFSTSERAIEASHLKNLSELLQRLGYIAGVSNTGRNFYMLRTLASLAAETLTLSRKLESEHPYSNIFLYDDYSIYYILDLCVREYQRVHGHEDIIYLIRYDVIALYRYDKKNNTDLLDTLFCYLLSGRDINKTAQQQFLHRNSVLNRLRRIREITDLDLDDGRTQFSLILSCYIVQYYRKQLEHDIRV